MPAKLIFGMGCSIDGYVSSENPDVSLPMPGEALHRYYTALTRTMSVALYGRKMYEIMRYWDTADTQPDASPWDVEFAKAWQKVPKVVVSSTLREVGDNARLLTGDTAAGIRALKAETSGSIDVAGPTLAAYCAKLGLMDEYHLHIQPVVLGSGLHAILEQPAGGLHLKSSEALPEDTIVLRYAVGRA